MRRGRRFRDIGPTRVESKMVRDCSTNTLRESDRAVYYPTNLGYLLYVTRSADLEKSRQCAQTYNYVQASEVLLTGKDLDNSFQIWPSMALTCGFMRLILFRLSGSPQRRRL